MNPLENLLGALLVGGTLAASPLLRDWYNRWGATEAETRRALPGDDLVPHPILGYTRAITIATPVERVWPWLAQIGQGRGGLYSYDGLENLVGCQIHSVERILPEHQNPQVGEPIRLGPPGYPCFAVAAVEPPTILTLVSADPQTGQPTQPGERSQKAYSHATWQFCLEPAGAGRTRLLVRQRLDFNPDMAWIWRLTEPVGFVMERRMLLGIRSRAERNPSQP